MKVRVAFVFLFVFCYVECGRKAYIPLDKNANVAFINMEGGGVKPAPPVPIKPAAQPAPVPAKPALPPQPAKPAVLPQPAKPAVAPQPAPKPIQQQPKPATSPTQIKPVPVYPTPASVPISTPGPGSVKQLVNFYDSQGKASPIRPYSYSQAVKQG